MLVDIILILLLFSIVFRGRETGLVRQLTSAAGFIGGLFIGAALQPYALNYADTTLSRAMMSILVTLGSALFFMHIGEIAGAWLKFKIRAWMPLNKADAVLGAAAGAVTLLLVVWLLTPALLGLPSPGIQQALHRSVIVGSLNSALPSAPDIISRVDRLINPNGFPDVFAGLERQPLKPDAPLPSLGELQPAVTQTRASIVKLEGRGCGGVVEGSGFVAADRTIVTNAHVVAGVSKPVIVDTSGQHAARVIWFDEKLDMAVLQVSDKSSLAGVPLKINTSTAANGTPAVAVGFPGGGGFKVSPATVLDQFSARGRDIYGRGITNREVYELNADIIPGNSGGPLLDKQGQVIGLIFAESVNYENVGYALTTQPVADGLKQALQRNAQVSSGACAG